MRVCDGFVAIESPHTHTPHTCIYKLNPENLSFHENASIWNWPASYTVSVCSHDYFIPPYTAFRSPSLAIRAPYMVYIVRFWATLFAQTQCKKRSQVRHSLYDSHTYCPFLCSDLIMHTSIEGVQFRADSPPKSSEYFFQQVQKKCQPRREFL